MSNVLINQCVNLKRSQSAEHQGDRYQYTVATCSLIRTDSAWSSGLPQSDEKNIYKHEQKNFNNMYLGE